MANVAYYIKKKSGDRKAAIMQVKEYRNISQGTLTNSNLIASPQVYNHLGAELVNVNHCDRETTIKDIDFFSIDIDTAYTCYLDEIMVGGAFCIRTILDCDTNELLSPSNSFNSIWTGIFFRLHGDNRNFLVAYTNNALLTLNRFDPSATDNLFYTSKPENQDYNKLCRHEHNYFSAIFYVKYASATLAFATAPNGYLYGISKSNNYFYVTDIVRTTNYYNQSGPVYHTKKHIGIDKWVRELLPAFAIDSKNNVTIYSVGDALFRVYSFPNNISLLHYTPDYNQNIINIFLKYNRSRPFIVDLCVIPNKIHNNVYDVLAVVVGLEGRHMQTTFYDGEYLVHCLAVLYYKQETPTLYKVSIKWIDAAQILSQYPMINTSESFVILKNIIRIQAITDEDFYVTIGHDLLVTSITKDHSLMHFHYDHSSRDVTLVSKACGIPPLLGKNAIAYADSPMEILVPENIPTSSTNGIDLNYLTLQYSLQGNCIANTLSKVIPNTDQMTTEIVWNDIIGASANTSLIKLVNCNDANDIIYPNALSNVTLDMVGKVVNIHGKYDCCYIILRNDNCLSEEPITQYVLITKVYDGCRDCNGIKLNNVTYDLSYSAYQPGIKIGLCDPDEYIFNMCKFASSAYYKMLRDVYKVKTCCSGDYDRDWVKGYLYDLLAKESDICLSKPCYPLCVIEERVVKINYYIDGQGYIDNDIDPENYRGRN